MVLILTVILMVILIFMFFFLCYEAIMLHNSIEELKITLPKQKENDKKFLWINKHE